MRSCVVEFWMRSCVFEFWMRSCVFEFWMRSCMIEFWMRSCVVEFWMRSCVVEFWMRSCVVEFWMRSCFVEFDVINLTNYIQNKILIVQNTLKTWYSFRPQYWYMHLKDTTNPIHFELSSKNDVIFELISIVKTAILIFKHELFGWRDFDIVDPWLFSIKFLSRE